MYCMSTLSYPTHLMCPHTKTLLDDFNQVPLCASQTSTNMLPVSPHQPLKQQHGLQHEHSVFMNANWHRHECNWHRHECSWNTQGCNWMQLDADETDLLTIDNHLMPKTSGKTKTGSHPRRHAL